MNQRLVFHLYDDGDPTFVAERDGSNARELFTLERGRPQPFSSLVEGRTVDLTRREASGTREKWTSGASR